MRCQWPIQRGDDWPKSRGRCWRKCYREAHFTVAGLELCLQHAYAYRMRFHAWWMAEGMRSRSRSWLYSNVDATIRDIETGKPNRTITYADTLQYQLMHRRD